MVRNSLNRESQKVEKLNEQRKKEVEKDIQNFLRECNDYIDLIEEYNDSMPEDLRVENMYTYLYRYVKGDPYEGCSVNLNLKNTYNHNGHSMELIDRNTKIHITYFGWGCIDKDDYDLGRINPLIIPLDDENINYLQKQGESEMIFVPCYKLDIMEDPCLKGEDFVVFNTDDAFKMHTDIDTILQTPVDKDSLWFWHYYWTLNFHDDNFGTVVNKTWQHYDNCDENINLDEIYELEEILKCAKKVAKKW